MIKQEAVLPSAERCEELAARLSDLDHTGRMQVRAILRSIPTLLNTARAEDEAAARAEQWRADREATLEALRQHGYAGESVRRILAALDAIKPEGA